jgi:flagellar hook-length control protein FliK
MNALPSSAPIAALAVLPGAVAPGGPIDVGAVGARPFDQLLGPVDELPIEPVPEAAEAGASDGAAMAVVATAPSPPSPPAPDALLAAMLDALSLRSAPVADAPLADTAPARSPATPHGDALAGVLSPREAGLCGPQTLSQLLAAMLALRTAPAVTGLDGAPEPLDDPALPNIVAAPDGDGTAGSRAGVLGLLALAPAPVPPPTAATLAPMGCAPAPALPPTAAIPAPSDAATSQLAPPLVSGGESADASAQTPILVASPESRVDGAVFSMGAAAPAAASPPQGGAQAMRADGALAQIAVPFDSPQWGNELASRVVTMSREQWSQARIRVTPDELGPIEITLRFDGEKVHAQFGAVTPEAREALSSNMHRLRELLSSEGLNLGQSFVGQQGGGERRTHDSDGFRLAADSNEVEHGMVGGAAPVASRSGLLDEFA